MLDFLAIDFETANENAESACALGIANVAGGNIVATDSWLIRPPEKYFTFRKTNRDIHGIGRGQLKDKEQFHQLWPMVSPYIANRVIVAHNAAGTEINILRKLFAYFSIEPPEFRYLCTKQVARALWNDSLQHFGLSDVAKFLQCSFAHHDPQDDAKLCATILLRAAQETNASNLDELAERIHVEATPFSMIRESVKAYGREIYGSHISLDDLGVSLDHEEEDNLDALESLYGFTARDIKGHCSDPGVFDRGKKLFKSNSVEVTSKSGVRYEAHVKARGKTPYEVTVDAGLNATCTCQAWNYSRERFCKHCVALALVWDSEGGPTQFDELADGDRKAAILDTLDQLSPQECKKILLALAESETDAISRLLFEVEVEVD